MTDIFDPIHCQGVRRPLPDAVLPPPWRHASRVFHQREADTILTRSGGLAGRVEQLPDPGDYRIFDPCGRQVRRHA